MCFDHPCANRIYVLSTQAVIEREYWLPTEHLVQQISWIFNNYRLSWCSFKSNYHKINQAFVPEQVASKGARDDGRDPALIESQGTSAERNAFFTRLQDGYVKAVMFWKRIRDAHVTNNTKLYTRINVNLMNTPVNRKLAQRYWQKSRIYSGVEACTRKVEDRE